MSKLNFKKGFTLIELLVVISIIALIAAVIVASLNTGSQKGKNAAIKKNLANARTQAEVFYNGNTAANLSFTNVCSTGIVGGVQGIGALVVGAAKARGFSDTDYFINATGTASNAVCNWSASAWAAQVPMLGGGFWCVDSTNKSAQNGSNSLSSGTDYTCN